MKNNRGYCELPLQGSCEYANACYARCLSPLPKFLPHRRSQLKETRQPTTPQACKRTLSGVAGRKGPAARHAAVVSGP